MRPIKAFAIILFALLFTQCQKDLSYVGGPDPSPVLPAPITARLHGTVLDENGLPAIGVTVKVGVTSVTTDNRGYFRIQNASLDKKSSVVSAEKTGYFKAFRTFNATAGTNQVIIKLIKKTIAGTIDAGTGGNVTLTNGGKVVLPANAIVTASNNSTFSGTVNVYASYIDPTAADISQTVPGSFMADDANGTRVTLASYGMMAVVLESTAGEKLQIKTGSVASLTTPIPASRLSTAPATIPLWSVDEQSGIWKEEGSATKQGNVYVGDVKHFSFWNCDIPMNAIVLSMTLKNSAGNPLVHAHVKISRPNPPQQTHGFTDSLGEVSGWVPSNEVLLMEVLDMCGNPFYSQSIGPFSSDTDLGVITLSPSSSANILTVTGRLLDCSANPVSNGYALIYYGYHTRYAATDPGGNFTTNFTSCSSSPSTINIVGIDLATNQQSTTSNITVTSPVTNAGNITACGTSASEFLNYTWNGTNYTIGGSGAPASDSLSGNTSGTAPSFSTFIMGSQSIGVNTFIYFTFSHNVLAPGTYPMTSLSVNNTFQITPDPGSTVVLTSYPANIGQFYEGSFSATTGGGTNTLTGTFRIRR